MVTNRNFNRIVIVLMLCFAGFIAASVLENVHDKNTKIKQNNLNTAKEYNTYHGMSNGYIVEISETREMSDPPGVYRIIIHLNKPDDPSYVGITGHDYRHRRHQTTWDRVFYCGYPKQTNGCNSYLFDADGTKTWEPCPAGKDKLKPFTDDEVDRAISLLNVAMATVHTKANKVNELVKYP